MIRVKVCGITNLEDALLATQLGAWALGFNFYKKSPRYIDPIEAGRIINHLPAHVLTVGVFVNEIAEAISAVKEITAIDYVQLHGDESAAFAAALQLPLIKALRLEGVNQLSEFFSFKEIADFILADAFSQNAYGGTGKQADWETAALMAKEHDLILAGGLTVGNVLEAIEVVQPAAIDLCSGVEKALGKKCPEKMARFFDKLKQVKTI